MNNTPNPTTVYRCHKTVRAAKIVAANPTQGYLDLLEGDRQYRHEVPFSYFNRHRIEVGGYFVVYEDGYESFSPAKAFEEGYSIISASVLNNFGVAIEALKQGKRVARAGWNGKGMYLWLLPAATIDAAWCREAHLKEVAEANGGQIDALGSIRMLTADRKVLTGWLASQTDILAEDWEIMD